MFETFSYLPPLSDDQIARQVDYIVNNGWTPCLEFSEAEYAYVSSASTIRMGAVTSVSCKSFVWTLTKPMQPRTGTIALQQPPHSQQQGSIAVALVASSPAPCLMFSQNYFDNRYWTMWKLPMFGCTDPVQVGPEEGARSVPAFLFQQQPSSSLPAAHSAQFGSMKIPPGSRVWCTAAVIAASRLAAASNSTLAFSCG